MQNHHPKKISRPGSTVRDLFFALFVKRTFFRSLFSLCTVGAPQFKPHRLKPVLLKTSKHRNAISTKQADISRSRFITLL